MEHIDINVVCKRLAFMVNDFVLDDAEHVSVSEVSIHERDRTLCCFGNSLIFLYIDMF